MKFKILLSLLGVAVLVGAFLFGSVAFPAAGNCQAAAASWKAATQQSVVALNVISDYGISGATASLQKATADVYKAKSYNCKGAN